ncbi:MAG: hypothetical protein DRN83_03285 [Hadesarchaea archaeon]|nr:MAG: hypothetical protein DRN83_03285 [Hadesarchaea archaeon]
MNLEKNRNKGLSAINLLLVIFIIGCVVLSLFVVISYPEMEPSSGNEVGSLLITGVSPVAAGESSQIIVRAFDKNGNPISGADISLFYSILNSRESWNIALPLTDLGDGRYSSTLTTQWANNYVITARANGTSIRTSTEITVSPGKATDVVVISDYPNPVSDLYTSILTFYFIDQYGNIVPRESVDPQVESTLGYVGETLPLQSHPDDTFTVSIDADNWGTAEVNITDKNTGAHVSKEVDFNPVYVDLTYELLDPTIEFLAQENLEFVSYGDRQAISLNIGIFSPPEIGTLGEYEVKVEYDASSLNIVNVTDPDPDDNFAGPEWWVYENIITLTASGNAMKAGTNIARLLFEPWEWAKQKGLNFIIWIERLWNESLESVELPPGMVVENGKIFEKLFVPVKIWIVDNVRDEEEILEIAELTENIYNMNSKACRFKYWFIFLTEINHISENEWKTKVPTGHIEGDDPGDPWYPEPNADNQRRNLVNQNKWERWINIYWLPDNSFGEFGWYKENVIFIDNANEGKDNHITLAHELAHLLSGGKVEDPVTPTEKSQGADNYCNLMAYDFNKSHENLTVEQTKLIENWIDSHSEQRPGTHGGGRIIKPVPY